jgi:hypothetical protein
MNRLSLDSLKTHNTPRNLYSEQVVYPDRRILVRRKIPVFLGKTLYSRRIITYPYSTIMYQMGTVKKCFFVALQNISFYTVAMEIAFRSTNII